MDTGRIKEYIYRNLKGWLILLMVNALFALIIPDFYPLYIVIFILGAVTENSRNIDQAEKIKKLKSKGLTEQDIANICFLKKWEQDRKKGIWRYCIKDGGIIAGALLSFVFTILFFSITHKNILQMFPDPGAMLRIIGCAYLCGAISGILAYRILWVVNERRFLRLTDPLNTIFTDKKESLNDLI